jgi:hypothetical protein
MRLSPFTGVVLGVTFVYVAGQFIELGREGHVLPETPETHHGGPVALSPTVVLATTPGLGRAFMGATSAQAWSDVLGVPLGARS